MPMNGLGKLLCIHCNAEMQATEIQSAATLHKYIFECLACERIRVIEVAPKLSKNDYEVRP